MTILKRLYHHRYALLNNKHKNENLQKEYNFYGANAFEINILKITDEPYLYEQSYLDRNINTLYNINTKSTGTPTHLKEAVVKRSQTMKDKYRKGELKSQFPKTPWNKGMVNMDCSYLKKPKTITDSLKQAHRNTSLRARKQSRSVEVYDNNMKYLGVWRSSKDVEDDSLSYNFPLILTKVSTNRVLNSGNINKSIKLSKPYKGLYFKYAEYKTDELRETPVEDNPQPIS